MDHTDDTTNKMCGKLNNTDPTTASASEPPHSPATNDPRRTGDDTTSRSATSTSNLGITTTTLHDARLRNLTTANRATSNARTEYHALQAEATRQRIGALQKPLVLTEEHVNVLTEKRGLEDLVRICRTIETCAGIYQEAEIKLLEERLADIKYVDYMDEMLECIK